MSRLMEDYKIWWTMEKEDGQPVKKQSLWNCIYEEVSTCFHITGIESGLYVNIECNGIESVTVDWSFV